MSSVKNYLANARNFANERYSNMNGNYRNFAPNSLGGRTMLSADGSSAASAGQSQPYIIVISNASAAAVPNFDVLGAYTYLNETTLWNSGSLTLNGVTISSAIPNVTYQQFLFQSMQQPFSVGLTYIESVAGTASQVTTPFQLNTQDANGNQALRAMIPTIDPYQQQTTVVAVKQLYRIDGFTKLTFSQIAASVVFRVHFYPSDNINLANGLAGAPVAQQYSSPNVIKIPTING
jgi:hypothetical protein